MKDQLGHDISVGDVVVYPGGNARYGGLNLMVGVVRKLTECRASLVAGPLASDGKAFKKVSKSGAKLLLCRDEHVTKSDVVKSIIKEIESNGAKN